MSYADQPLTVSPAAPGVPQVVFYDFLFGEDVVDMNSYGDGHALEPMNATEYVTAVSWTHSIKPPYETMRINLKGPQGRVQQVLPKNVNTTKFAKKPLGDGTHKNYLGQPVVGFYCILWLPNKDTKGKSIWSAVHWGRCTSISLRSQSSEDGRVFTTVELGFESFLSIPMQSNIYLAPGSSYSNEGYSYTFQSWADEMTKYLSGFAGLTGMESEGIGGLFAQFWATLMKGAIPNSICSFTGPMYESNYNGNNTFNYGLTPDQRIDFLKKKYAGSTIKDVGAYFKIRDRGKIGNNPKKRPYSMGELVGCAYSRASCMVYAPMRMAQHRDVPGDGFGSTANMFPRGTVWSWFRSVFFSVDEIIECFPSLEWPVMWNGKSTAEVIWSPDNTTTSNEAAIQNALKEIVPRFDDDRLWFAYGSGQSAQLWNELEAAIAIDTKQGKFNKDWSAKDFTDAYISPTKMKFAKPNLVATGKVPAPFSGDPKKHSALPSLADIQAKGEPRSLAGTRAVMCEAMGGSMPVMVYRVKPRVSMPVNQKSATELIRARFSHWKNDKNNAARYYRIVVKPTASEKIGYFQYPTAIAYYPNIRTLDGGPNWWCYIHSPEEVLSVNTTLQDGNRCNAMYTKTPIQPNSQMELHGMMGEVTVDNNDVHNHGMRLKTIDYPFYPTALTNDYMLGSFNDKLNAMTELFFLVLGNKGSYGSGSATVMYKPWMKAGYWTTGPFPFGTGNPVVDTQAQRAYTGGLENIEKAFAAIKNTEGLPGWSGYIQSVEHSVQVQETGEVVKRTQLTMSDMNTTGWGTFLETYPYWSSNLQVAKHPFVFRGNQVVTGHLVDTGGGNMEFKEGPAP